jgi:hypothetical protein
VLAPPVELVLQLVDGASRGLQPQPRFRRLVRAFQLPAGLRVPGREQICVMPIDRSIRSKSAAPCLASRPVKQLPLSLMTCAGSPHSSTAVLKASQAARAVGPVSTRTATSAREWSSRTSIIHTVWPSASAWPASR